MRNEKKSGKFIVCICAVKTDADIYVQLLYTSPFIDPETKNIEYGVLFKLPPRDKNGFALHKK